MNRVTMKCVGVPEEIGVRAAKEIQQEFDGRPHHVDAQCSWRSDALFLTVWNGFDVDGSALRDEFSEALTAYVGGDVGEDIETVEVLAMS